MHIWPLRDVDATQVSLIFSPVASPHSSSYHSSSMGGVQWKPCCCRCGRLPEHGDEAEDLSERRVSRHVLTGSLLCTADVPSHGLQLQYAWLTQRGYYPGFPERENQDSLCANPRFQSNPDLHFFGVFDGHGYFGTQCATFTRDKLTGILSSDTRLLEDPSGAYESAFLATNAALHASDIDDSESGTTAVTVLVTGDTLFVANVGDSRAVAGVRDASGRVVARDLSSDQTPKRRDEYERVQQCGARVLTTSQVQGIKDPSIQSWGDEDDDDPPRLWLQHEPYPGAAFTRSVGDSTAESIGVTAVPEVMTVKITPDLLFFVVASDGVFQFLSSQTVVDMVAKFMDPRDACSEIAAESYRIWLERDYRTDDIAIIVVHIKHLGNLGADGSSQASTKSAQLISKNRGVERETCCQGRRNFSKLQSDTPHASVEWSPACVAPSTTHAMLRNVTNAGPSSNSLYSELMKRTLNLEPFTNGKLMHAFRNSSTS